MLGGIGAGKSHVARRTAALSGGEVVDADRLAGTALMACAADGSLAAALGSGFVTSDGEPDRAAIANRVFEDAQALSALEGLLHPLVTAVIEERLEAHREGEGPALLILDIPLLLENGFDRHCDVLWFVEAPAHVRASRTGARGLAPDDVRRRERCQAPLEGKRERADAEIDNENDPDPGIREALASMGVPVHTSST